MIDTNKEKIQTNQHIKGYNVGHGAKRVINVNVQLLCQSC